MHVEVGRVSSTQRDDDFSKRLRCCQSLALALEHDPEGLDAGDVALAVKAITDAAITNLDSVSLQRRS